LIEINFQTALGPTFPTHHCKWVIRKIIGVERIIIGIHFTKKKIKTLKEKLIER